MHSLKNTVVAVCLLGLSFFFYQASSRNSSDDSDLFPAVEISEGTESLANEGAELFPAPAVQPPSDNLAMAMAERPSAILSPLELMAPAENNIDDEPVSPSAAPELLEIGIQPPTALVPSLPVLPRQMVDHVDRDQGLIAALETQNQNVTNNEFVSTPGRAGHSMDFSFNRQVSGDPAMEFEPAVMNADREPEFSELNYQSVWPQIDKLVAEHDYRTAHQLLSRFYDSDDLSGPQRQRLIGWLDALAGKVIFSSEHHLVQQPYTVGMNESLTDVGQRWGVPAQLVYNVNQNSIPNPLVLTPGTQLKSVQGPFRAEIDLNQKVMTLFLGDLYAGRYPVRIGISGATSPGDFDVMVKSEEGHNWRDAEGNDYPPGSQQNGYGRYWIGLTGSLCIHAISESTGDGHHGCIGLSENDAKDVFAILGKGSTLSIVR